jgi:uncharacterized protein (TIGR04255 family)
MAPRTGPNSLGIGVSGAIGSFGLSSFLSIGLLLEPALEAHEIALNSVTFASPPVNEVYLSVQFSTPVADEAVALADFWPLVREEFPQLQRQPPLPRLEERFDAVPTPQVLQFPVPFPLGGGPQRYWFISADSTRLIQLQPDRLWFNWRRTRETDVYPRYQTLRHEFAGLFSTFLSVLPEDRRAGAAIDMCELGYINHIDARGELNPNSHLPLHRILEFIGEPPTEALSPVEDVQVQLRSVLRGHDRSPLGRMYLNASPAFRAADRMPIYLLELTVRIKPTGATTEDALAALDQGHELVVAAFRDVTTEEFHRVWGLEDADGDGS